MKDPEEKGYHGSRTWFSKTTTELFIATVNKVKIARMISIIRNE
jgi:hypothetical protein